MNGAPVFVFAYANDRLDDKRYLRNLEKEEAEISGALREAVDDGRCRVVTLFNASTKRVQDECKRLRGRLTAFHFAGHADGCSLLLEGPDRKPTRVGADVVARFFTGLRGLHLVFLNGCSTAEQVKALRDAGVDVVVATSKDVRDDVATAFAVAFYGALAGAASIDEAFIHAKADLQLAVAPGGDDAELIRAVWRDVDAPASRLPSSVDELFVREGSPRARAAVLLPPVTRSDGPPPTPHLDLIIGKKKAREVSAASAAAVVVLVVVMALSLLLTWSP